MLTVIPSYRNLTILTGYPNHMQAAAKCEPTHLHHTSNHPAATGDGGRCYLMCNAAVLLCNAGYAVILECRPSLCRPAAGAPPHLSCVVCGGGGALLSWLLQLASRFLHFPTFSSVPHLLCRCPPPPPYVARSVDDCLSCCDFPTPSDWAVVAVSAAFCFVSSYLLCRFSTAAAVFTRCGGCASR